MLCISIYAANVLKISSRIFSEICTFISPSPSLEIVSPTIRTEVQLDTWIQRLLMKCFTSMLQVLHVLQFFLFIFALINLSWYNHGNVVLDDGIANNP